MKVALSKEFTYWHGGYIPKVYGPGDVDVPDEVAEAAKVCGVVVEEKTVSKTDSKTTKGKK